jgi:hypothetical protein
LEFGLRENVRADEKLTAFLELESAIKVAPLIRCSIKVPWGFFLKNRGILPD